MIPHLCKIFKIKDKIQFTIKIYYLNSIEELGSLEYWKNLITELYINYNYSEIKNNFNYEIWHNNHPLLNEYLKDYDKITPGDQRAAGIETENYIAIAVDPQNPLLSNSIYTAQVLSHEFGHHIFRNCNFYNSKLNNLQLIIKNYYEELRPKKCSFYEEWAELWKAFFGNDKVKYCYSDNVSIFPNQYPKLYILMKLSECLIKNFSHLNIEKINIHYEITNSYIYGWIVLDIVYQVFWIKKYNYIALDTNFSYYQYINDKWIYIKNYSL